MHESVLPWLIEKMEGFLNDEEYIETNAETILNDAYYKSVNAHKLAIADQIQRKEDMVYATE